MAFERGTFTGDPNGCLVIIGIGVCTAVLTLGAIAQSPFEGIQRRPVPNEVNPNYTPQVNGLTPMAQNELRDREELAMLRKEVADLRNMLGHLQWTVYGPERYRQMKPYQSDFPPWWSDADRTKYRQITPSLLNKGTP